MQLTKQVKIIGCNFVNHSVMLLSLLKYCKLLIFCEVFIILRIFKILLKIQSHPSLVLLMLKKLMLLKISMHQFAENLLTQFVLSAISSMIIKNRQLNMLLLQHKPMIPPLILLLTMSFMQLFSNSNHNVHLALITFFTIS